MVAIIFSQMLLLQCCLINEAMINSSNNISIIAKQPKAWIISPEEVEKERVFAHYRLEKLLNQSAEPGHDHLLNAIKATERLVDPNVVGLLINNNIAIAITKDDRPRIGQFASLAQGFPVRLGGSGLKIEDLLLSNTPIVRILGLQIIRYKSKLTSKEVEILSRLVQDHSLEVRARAILAAWAISALSKSDLIRASETLFAPTTNNAEGVTARLVLLEGFSYFDRHEKIAADFLTRIRKTHSPHFPDISIALANIDSNEAEELARYFEIVISGGKSDQLGLGYWDAARVLTKTSKCKIGVRYLFLYSSSAFSSSRFISYWGTPNLCLGWTVKLELVGPRMYDENSHVRLGAVRVVGRMGLYGFPFVGRLFELLSDPDDLVRWEAYGTLMKLREDLFSIIQFTTLLTEKLERIKISSQNRK